MRPTERLEHGRRQPPWLRHEHLERYRFASRFVQARAVVDCACGDGTGARLLIEADASHVLAFDLSPEAVAMVAVATDRSIVDAKVADACSLPLPASSVDVYVSLETIEHIPDYHGFLDEVVRVLRDDGILVCSTPNRAVYSPGHTAISTPWNPFHVREFDIGEFLEILSAHFATVELHGQNPRGRGRARAIGAAGRILPWNLAVRLRQTAKLPLFLLDSAERHRVRPLDRDRPPEILVAVCNRPRPQGASAG